MKILSTKLQKEEGCIWGTIWLGDWLIPTEFLRFVGEFLAPYKILSYSVRYIYGYAGKETQVQVLGVKMKEVEVNEKET